MTNAPSRGTAVTGQEKVSRTKLRDQIGAVLASDVVSGAMPSGSSLPASDDLVDRFGVSKTVVRETIQELESAGLIRVRQGTRAAVLPEDEWDLRDPLVFSALQANGLGSSLVAELYEVRLLLEPKVAGQAAVQATDAQRQALKASLDELEQAAGTDARSFLVADKFLHDMLLGIARSNRVLRAILRDLNDLWALAWTVDIDEDQISELLQQHILIGAAVISGDQQGAEDAMRRHLEFALMADLAS